MIYNECGQGWVREERREEEGERERRERGGG